MDSHSSGRFRAFHVHDNDPPRPVRVRDLQGGLAPGLETGVRRRLERAGRINRQSTLSREHQGPRAVLNALERLATGYGSECVRVRQDLAIAESQLRDYRERLGKPFAHEQYLSELTALRDQLKA